MKEHLQKMLAAAAGHAPDALMVAGAGAVSCGTGMVYAPAGWIVGGLFSLVAGVVLARSAA